MNLGNINLRILETSDFTKEYLDWFDDKDIVEFSDNQYRKFTRKSQLEYIKRLKKDDSYNLYGIFYKKKHIGNILLGPINEIHKRAEISYMIGDKNFWGVGVGSHFISLIITIVKENLKLKKLCASCASKNIGSKKVLIKNNFKIEGRRKKHVLYNGKWQDTLEFGLIL